MHIASKSFAFLIIEHALLKEDKNRSGSFSRLVKQPKSSWRNPSGNFIIGAIISRGKMEDVSRTGVGLEMCEPALHFSSIATAVRWILGKKSRSAFKFDWACI